MAPRPSLSAILNIGHQMSSEFFRLLYLLSASLVYALFPAKSMVF